MRGEILYAISTVANWAAVMLSVRALFLVCQLGLGVHESRRAGLINNIRNSVLTILALFLIGGFVPHDVGRDIKGEGIAVPAVWFYAPFWGWASLIGVVAVAVSISKYVLGLAPERTARLMAIGQSVVFTMIAIGAFVKRHETFTILRGKFYFSVQQLATLAIMVILTVIVASALGRASAGRKLTRKFATHVALLIGSAIFALPFAWLLSASFKEDRDLTGEVNWIPKVTQMHDYFDPINPQYQGKFEGTTVVGDLIRKLPDDRVQLDIMRPYSLRGRVLEEKLSALSEVPRQVPVVKVNKGTEIWTGMVTQEHEDGTRTITYLEPASAKGKIERLTKDEAPDFRPFGLRFQNYPDALQYLPPETGFGLVYFKNTVLLAVLNVIGTVMSCAFVAYGFARLRFPGREFLFGVLLSTMMLPSAITLLPQFLIFRQLGWIDTLLPLWVPSFFASAFNVFLLRQFFRQIPQEFEDAARIDGCTYLRTFWSILLPQIKPALTVVAIWTLMSTWNNFLGPLIYVNSPENMPISYALQLFSGDRSGEPSLLMAFSALSMMPVLAIFAFAQKYFIDGVTLSGLGGR